MKLPGSRLSSRKYLRFGTSSLELRTPQLPATRVKLGYFPRKGSSPAERIYISRPEQLHKRLRVAQRYRAQNPFLNAMVRFARTRRLLLETRSNAFVCYALSHNSALYMLAFDTYSAALACMPLISSSVSCRTTFPGAPRISDRSGNIFPSGITAPAATIQFSPITASLRIVA